MSSVLRPTADRKTLVGPRAKQYRYRYELTLRSSIDGVTEERSSEVFLNGIN